MHKRIWTVAISLVCLFTILTPAIADEITIDKLPPSVIKTVPQSGDINVDPKLNELSIVFSKDMFDQAWSLVSVSEESFPKLLGSPQYNKDKRTCVVKMALEPDRTYAIWVNSESHGNFKDSNQIPAVPYLVVFRTAKSK
jgi:hypothetical protein